MLLLRSIATLAIGDVRQHITIGHRTGTVAPTFLAHGWEPWTATMAFGLFREPSFVRALSHLRGQTIRFGGISADWLDYVVEPAVSPPCEWSREAGRPFTAGGQCRFSTGSFDLLLDTVDQAGIGLLFDLNELLGRNCSQPTPRGAHRPVGKGPEWCGDVPAAWNMGPVRSLLRHIRSRDAKGLPTPVALELGNELFLPQHLSRKTAMQDITRLAELLQTIWASDNKKPPRFYATGTNDCAHVNNNETMATLQSLHASLDVGFSFHSYPGNLQRGWNKSDLTSFLLNTSWLQNMVLADARPCLAALKDLTTTTGTTRQLPFAVTEAQSMCGGKFEDGAPTPNSFINGFFTIANLGQYARAGAALVARWGIPDMLNAHNSDKPWDPSGVASDFFLYIIYQSTVGPGVLHVVSAGGEDHGPALVYAHCAAHARYGTNGSVTIYATNPTSSAIQLHVSGASEHIPTQPRVEYVLTAPGGDLSERNPLLNGQGPPLKLGADGSLPHVDGKFCAVSNDCSPWLTLPARSHGFWVLLAAHAHASCG